MPSILGFLGPHKKTPPAPTQSRIGGHTTVWADFKEKFPQPLCGRCEKELSLLAQIDTSYAEGQSRVLLIFLCLNESGCHLTSVGWKVYRFSRYEEPTNDFTTNEATTVNFGSTFVPAETEDTTASLTDIADLLSQLTIAPQREVTDIAQPQSPNNEKAFALIESDSAPVLPCHILQVQENTYRSAEALLDDLQLRSSALAVNYKSSGPAMEGEEYETNVDPTTLKFEKRMRLAPEQIARYELKGRPLWLATPSPQNCDRHTWALGTEVLPRCPRCGGPRVAELQLISTLTSLMDACHPNDEVISKMLWGTAQVYTCEKDCRVGEDKFDFAEELIVVQSV